MLKDITADSKLNWRLRSDTAAKKKKKEKLHITQTGTLKYHVVKNLLRIWSDFI